MADRYEVIVTAETKAALRREAQYIADESGFMTRAIDWLKGAHALVDGLEMFPRRCPIAEEDGYVSYEVRRLKHGRHLLLFTINDEENVVYVIGCRHGMRASRPDDLPGDVPQD